MSTANSSLELNPQVENDVCLVVERFLTFVCACLFYMFVSVFLCSGPEVDAAGGRAGHGGRASGFPRGGITTDAVPSQARSHGCRLR